MLTDQFRQRHQNSRLTIMQRVSVFFIFLIMSAGTLCFFLYFSKPQNLNVWQSISDAIGWPNIPWYQSIDLKISDRFSTPKTVHIIRSAPHISADASALYFTCDCVPRPQKKAIMPFLKQFNIGLSERNIILDNRPCQELLIGPITQYSDLLRVQSFLKHFDHTTTTTTRS